MHAVVEIFATIVDDGCGDDNDGASDNRGGWSVLSVEEFGTVDYECTVVT